MTESIDDLRRQIDDLRREYEQSEADKIKAGELGMEIYKQKEELELRCDELRKALDHMRQEKDNAEKVSTRV